MRFGRVGAASFLGPKQLLEQEFQPELDYSRFVLLIGDHSERCRAGGQVGKAELRAVEDVEKLRAELNVVP
jgi:hypothetical protein